MNAQATTLDLARIIDDHFRVQVVAFGHVAPRGDVHVSDYGVMAHCGTRSVFNRATGLDLDQPDVSIGRVQRFFGDLPHALWLREVTVSDDVDALLRGRGYLPMRPVAGMGRELPAEGMPVRGDHRVDLVADPALAAGVAAVASSGFGFGTDDRMVLEDMIRNILRHARPFQHGAVYATREGDRPTSMGLLLCTSELAGMSTIATSPSHRQRGLATAVVTRALHDASALGYGLTGVVTNPDTGPLMTELGFEPVSWYRVYRQARR